MTDSETDPMRTYEPRVDAQRCIGCGLCADMMEEVFALNHDKFGIAYVHDADGWESDGAALLKETAENCPVAAILLYSDEEVGPGGLPIDRGNPSPAEEVTAAADVEENER